MNVKLVSTHSGFSDYLDGSFHQCLEDVALMRVLPNVRVIIPADAPSVEVLLREAEARGCLTVDDLWMLVYHGLKASASGRE
ncbi:hypothetical protein [Thermococcus piezophilus]|uniref:hypothetical protein n=1 Tax=Thermococcus piezophilus TaxID=1712654 RepID=UPI00373FE071